MLRRSFLGQVLKPVGLLAAACAAAPPADQGAPPAAPAPAPPAPGDEAAARRRSQTSLNPLAVAQDSFHRQFKDGSLTLEKFPDFIVTQCGLSRVQWSVRLLPEFTEARARALRSACDAVQLRSQLLDATLGPGLASADAAAREAALERLKPWFAVAAALGCSGVGIDLRGDGTYEEQLPRAAEGAALAAKAAAAAGLPLVVKSMGGMTSNGTFMAALMVRLNDPAIRVEPTFDSWQMDSKDTYNRMRGFELLLPYAASVLADYTAFLPAGDAVNFRTDYLMHTLRTSTFRGPVAILYKGAGDALDGVLKAKKILIKYKCAP
jgi:sugar phosphate isomerase/epimerase